MNPDLSRRRNIFVTRIEALTADTKRGWTVIVERDDGSLVELSGFSRLTLVNPRFGAVNYGKSPSGVFDQWAFHEAGGGGSVIVPFVRLATGEIFVGLLRESRPLQSDNPVLNVPRGMLDPGEDHLQAAKREFEEETGISGVSVFPLDGEPVNPNSTFFETWGKTPGGSAEGLHFFAIELPERFLVYNLRHCEFLPIFLAIGSGDGFTDIGIARLIRRYYGKPSFP